VHRVGFSCHGCNEMQRQQNIKKLIFVSFLILLVVCLTTVSICGYVATIGELGRICKEVVVADLK
jgi:hypothetical protein